MTRYSDSGPSSLMAARLEAPLQKDGLYWEDKLEDLRVLSKTEGAFKLSNDKARGTSRVDTNIVPSFLCPCRTPL
jgi:hypothetical protein